MIRFLDFEYKRRVDSLWVFILWLACHAEVRSICLAIICFKGHYWVTVRFHWVLSLSKCSLKYPKKRAASIVTSLKMSSKTVESYLQFRERENMRYHSVKRIYPGLSAICKIRYKTLYRRNKSRNEIWSKNHAANCWNVGAAIRGRGKKRGSSWRGWAFLPRMRELFVYVIAQRIKLIQYEPGSRLKHLMTSGFTTLTIVVIPATTAGGLIGWICRWTMPTWPLWTDWTGGLIIPIW